jgi:Zierdtviridae exonuclease
MPLDLSITPIVRGSEITDHKRCPQKWYWRWRQGLFPKARTSDALAFGTWVHAAFAAWYCGPGLLRGPHPAETFALLAQDDLRLFKTTDPTEEEVAKYTDLRELGLVLLDLYVQTYGRDESWSIIAPEQTFKLDVPFPEHWSGETRKIMARFAGTFDLPFRDLRTGWIWIGEHKTAGSIRLGHLPLDDQAGRYWAVAYRTLLNQGLIKPTDRIHGIMYNFIRKALPDPRPVDAQGYFVNKPTKPHYVAAITAHQPDALTGKETLEKLATIAATLGVEVIGDRSKIQPKPLFLRHPVTRTRPEQKSQLLRVQKDLEVMEMHRRGELPITKTTHHSCERFCDFYHMCVIHEASGNWKDIRKLTFNVQDPYADHRKSTEDHGSFEF